MVCPGEPHDGVPPSRRRKHFGFRESDDELCLQHLTTPEVSRSEQTRVRECHTAGAACTDVFRASLEVLE
jgi:hypothetical protein